jgi:outer membrane receptor protein involved in Fe transport
MRRFNPFILSTVSLAAIAASPAAAQQTKSDQPPPQALTTEQEIKSGADAQSSTNTSVNPNPTTNEAITVTGTRIRRPNLESPLPVTSVGGEEFFETGDVSVGDKLAELPQIASTFTQANSTRFLGTGGLNLLDLRNLGTARTLVLVNGRRHVGGDVLSSGVSTDVNTIPTDLIDRVDVVTGGNSAVYGSDAIAGVVNFILKTDYEGIQLRGQGGTSRYGDANSYFISGLVGKNFAGGRGNVAVNVEYARRDNTFGAHRRWLRNGLVTVDEDVGDEPNGRNGIPDNVLFRDVRSATFSNTGTLFFGAGIGAANFANFNCGVGTNGVPYACPFVFQPDGTLVAQTGERVGTGSVGAFIGGSGEGFYSGHQIQVTPQLDRYNISGVGHFEISPALVPFFEATFSRSNSVSQGGSGPAFTNGSAFQDLFQFSSRTRHPTRRNREQLYFDNPYLTQQARDTICGIFAARGRGDCVTVGRTGISINENLAGLPNRVEKARRDTFRIVGGIKGDIGSSWNYEVSANYGQLKERTQIFGNLNTQRMLLAMDAVRDPATGNIVCRSQIDPTAAFGGNSYFYYLYYGSSDPRAHGITAPNGAAQLAADVAACTPVNIMGGNFTQAQQDYLLANTTSHGKTSQFDLTAFISGDTSNFFNLPGGPIGLVAGVEYREDNLKYDQDPLVQQAYTFYNAIPTFKAPKQKVKEAFGEIRIPILKDRPFINELEIDGAARVSDYNLGKTGTIVAYNANAIYSPVPGLRFRGNYAKAVRAPNQSELFTPFGQNFAFVSDPCSVQNINSGTANRPANCLADGVPAGTRITYTSTLLYLSGGQQDLKAETSKSITLGGVLTPRFLPGFSASVDYYKIKVKNAIQFLSPQSIVNQCYDLPDLNNFFCNSFSRAGDDPPGHDLQPFGIQDNTLHATPLNFAKLKARGLDMEFAYRKNLGALGRLDTRLNWTHALELTFFTSLQNPNFGNRALSELGNPVDAFNWRSSLQHGRFTLGYTMRYIGKMTTSAYEDFFEFEGRPPQDADVNDKVFYPARFYHDLRLGVDVGPKYNFYMGIDNVTDTKPPYGLSGIGGGSAIYDDIGRFYYAGFKAKF